MMIERDFQDRLVEKCAVFGVYTKSYKASQLVYAGLWALQHRGQDSSGISSSDGRDIYTHKAPGLVASVYQEGDLDKLDGNIAIGHNRYATSGGIEGHIQPTTSGQNLFALAHNGTLPVRRELVDFLQGKDMPSDPDQLNDSELMHAAIEYYVAKGKPVEEAVALSFPLFTGAFSIVGLTKDKLIGLRDAHGIRPFCIGQLGDEGFVLSSETCGLDSIGAKYMRDVKPGEMVVIDKEGLHSYQLKKGEEKLDIFELVYFSRPDSFFQGKSINEIRREMGRQLARERTIDADIVIPVPNSAIPAALGYAEQSGVPFENGLLKNTYIHRTFINPSPLLRERDVAIKFSPMPGALEGKRVIVIEDSIVRGTTLKNLVSMIRTAGAKEVHLLSASPPVKFPDFYGIATPQQRELIASRMSIDQIRAFFGADSLQYLSYEGLIKATGLPESTFCTACYTGEYPIDIGENAQKINFSV
ncbi:MAG TPA: amidophosphoribosyltransferase [Gammaproteobacteria bacterium]|nr:amidophosphoribosyltransferase [Gammaproteobacteria bacterium]